MNLTVHQGYKLVNIKDDVHSNLPAVKAPRMT